MTGAEKKFLQEAVKIDGTRYLSSFVRDAALEKASTLMGRPPTARNDYPDTDGPLDVLYGYIGDELPEDHREPAVLFSTVQNFATLLSDQNRAILRRLAAGRADSVFALAKEVGVPYQPLCRTLRNMEAHRLITLATCGGKKQSAALGCKRISVLIAFRSSVIGNIMTLGLQSRDDEYAPPGADRIIASINELSAAIPGTQGLSILRTIADCNPESIATLGRLTYGDIPHNYVYRLTKLAEDYGLITFDEGNLRKPVLTYDAVRVDISFAQKDAG